jgi:hypothetical protein
MNVRMNVNRYMSSEKRSSGIFGDILRKEEEEVTHIFNLLRDED